MLLNTEQFLLWSTTPIPRGRRAAFKRDGTVLTGPLYSRLIALFRDALAPGLLPAHHDQLYGETADPAMLLVRRAGWRPWGR